MLHLEVEVTNAAELLATQAYGAGAKLRWESAPASTGPFVEGGTVALVATQILYDIWDHAGGNGTWYRTRISDTGASTFSAYSAAFEGGAVTRYAELGDVLPMFRTTPVAFLQARLFTLLEVATSQVIEQCGHRDYFRHPASGTTTWVADGNGTSILHVHEGLVQLDLLELSFDGGLTYVTADAGDYMLRGDSPYSAEPVPAGEPYFHVVFSGFPAATSVGGYTTFPPTVRSARLTGARGWPSVPRALVEATAQRARQLAAAEGTFSGASAGGADEYGHVSTTDRFWPQSLWNFLQAEHERFIGCRVARR